MAFAVRTRSARNGPEPDINVTPLVDVVLVLLIIFMVIAPALNDGEHLELPTIATPDPKPKDMNPIEVTMAVGGVVAVDKEHIDPPTLNDRLRSLHSADPERHLLLLTDERVPYKRVRETFAGLQKIGFKGLSLKVLERKPSGA